MHNYVYENTVRYTCEQTVLGGGTGVSLPLRKKHDLGLQSMKNTLVEIKTLFKTIRTILHKT